MKERLIFWLGILILIIIFSGCKKKEQPLFEVRTSETTGLTFNNLIQPHVNDTFNSLEFEYIYNGAGVATADFNNDGLLDLYFGGNIVSSKLFLNKGKLKFEDVTEESNTGTKNWVTGISVVDINSDGWNDIYVCVAGKTAENNRANFLFINQGLNAQGIPEFKEEALAYGLADTGYSTMAAFFDYDKDGDLDLYLLTNSLESFNRNNLRPKSVNGEAANTDRLYRNNGNNTFTNISREAGIIIEGWGLGVCIADINQDGWPDVYVANDFLSNDLIWINQKDGTFRDKAADYLQHQTHNGMGVDVADYNNDQLPDIVVLDMLPRDNFREKTMIARGSFDFTYMQDKYGYQKQYIRNTLQLNQGKMPDGDVKFSEIGYLAGVFRTDWSWAPLLADYDNDGYKDLFVANGYRKDVTNLDFIVYNNDNKYSLGTEEAKRKKSSAVLDSMPEVKIHNFLYRNKGDLTFEDVSEKWGFTLSTYSNGAVYADLDNDGDLDIINNNIDSDAILYENMLYNPGAKKGANHFLRVKLAADKGDESKLYGAKVLAHINGTIQYLEFSPYRGYKSTVEPFLHFGLGADSLVDTLTVIWPDNKITQKYNVQVNQVLNLSYQERGDPAPIETEPELLLQVKGKTDIPQKKYLFENVTMQTGLHNIKHEERHYVDFKEVPLLHKQLSVDGPYFAVGDLNNDGLEDVVMGADEGFATRILWQKANGSFKQTSLPFDSLYEDRDILIFDANKDSFNDLYVVSGGSQFSKNHERYQDRLYLNDGKGNFIDATANLPKFRSSGSVVKGADYDQDGDIDLFVGGRFIPFEYPLPAKSYILRNDGGIFRDVTQEVAPELENIGLVTDACWFDYDNNGTLDLVLVGEWMPVTIFKNQNQHKLFNVTSELDLERTNGWYHSVHAADLNHDGYLDLIVGNNGLNSYYQASADQPVEIFATDFDNNGTLDPILTNYNQDKRYISFFRDRLNDQINGIKVRFKRYKDFANATFDESFTKDELKEAYHGACYELSSFLLENKGGHNFHFHQLPLETQFSAIRSVEVEDLDGDGHLDLLVVGNSHAEELVRGWYDASYGYFLRGDGAFNFKAIKPSESGFVAEGDIRQIKAINLNGKKSFIISRNRGTLVAYSVTGTIKESMAKKEP